MAGACYQDDKYFVTELATLESIAQLSLVSSNQYQQRQSSKGYRVADIINFIED